MPIRFYCRYKYTSVLSLWSSGGGVPGMPLSTLSGCGKCGDWHLSHLVPTFSEAVLLPWAYAAVEMHLLVFLPSSLSWFWVALHSQPHLEQPQLFRQGHLNEQFLGPAPPPQLPR